MSKLVEYVGFFHLLKERVRETWTQCWSWTSSSVNGDTSSANDYVREVNTNFRTGVSEKLERLKRVTIQRIDHSSSTSVNQLHPDFSHVYRRKTRGELLKISAAVMGIEFAYAAETAFVSPLLLNIGLLHRNLSLMWFISPLLGFFITPILGSLSDGCRSQLGRRRPFIILLSVGIILGLILVPNGKKIGIWFGDTYKQEISSFDINPSVSTTRNASTDFVFLDPETETMFPSLNPSLTNPWTSNTSRNTNTYTNLPETWSYKSTSHRAKLKSKILNGIQKDTAENLGKDAWKILKKQIGEKELDGYFEEAETIVSKESQSHSNGKEFKNLDNTINYTRIDSDKVVGNSSKDNESGDSKSGYDSGFHHSWGLIFTVLGTVLLDFDADACQSPARAFMLDITLPEDHARGLSAFTVMAGLGGSIGYFLGALNWENTFIGEFFGGHVRAVFTLVLFIFIGCVVTTLRSFREIPIDRLWTSFHNVNKGTTFYTRFDDNNRNFEIEDSTTTTTTEDETSFNEAENSVKVEKTLHSHVETANATATATSTNTNPTRENAAAANSTVEVEPPSSTQTQCSKIPTFREYIRTIIYLPKSLQWLCLTNFFSWISLVSYSLYFTDFVGEAVFEGDPTAPIGSKLRINYESGVRFGCLGMSLYSLSCAIYSLQIQTLVQKFGARRIYICGQLVYSLGMICMAITRHPAGVLIFSWTAGIMYATLFTMPYLLVARYHANAEEMFVIKDGMPVQIRGLGTDIAIVSSMVFLAQMTQALTLGNVVALAGTTTVIIWAAAVLAFCGALSATKVLYLDL